MPDLTSAQALSAAIELENAFNKHELMRTRREIRARESPPDLEGAGISPDLKDLLSWQSEESEEEMHRYASAFSSAEAEVQVFSESEASRKAKKAEELESFYRGSLDILIEDDYPFNIHLAGDGAVAGRMDLRRPFWSGIPSRNGQTATDFNTQVDEHRKRIGLPFEFSLVDPSVFYYDEDKKRKKITVGVEVSERRESAVRRYYNKIGQKQQSKYADGYLNPGMPEDAVKTGSARKVKFVVLRTYSQVFHMILGDSKKDQEVLWEGPNIFGPDHTGYVLWRSRYTGLSDPEKRYDPFILSTLNMADLKNLLINIQTNFAIQAAQAWIEKLPEKEAPNIGRAITSSAKGAKAGRRVDRGRAGLELERGSVLRWREVSGDFKEILQTLITEEERGRFNDALMGEAAATATGRAIIRLQEAAGRQLRQGFKAKELASEEIIRIIRTTIFSHKDLFLADGRKIYIPNLVEGQDPTGLGKEEVIEISAEHDIPHSVSVRVAAVSEAAQLARHEEGIKLAQILSRDTLDTEFHGVKNIPLENRRRTKDQIRLSALPAAVKKATADVLALLEGRRPPNEDIVVPDPGDDIESGEAPKDLGGGQPPGVSGGPTAPQTEDVGIRGGGGPIPLVQ